jgi:hypothetical protein
MTVPTLDPMDQPVWGEKGIAKVINRRVDQTHHLLRQGKLDADKIGRLWTSTPRRLLAQFSGKKPSAVPAE